MKSYEVFLFARPEEKRAIERALISVVGPIYTAMPALGRGANGGIEYDVKKRSAVARLFSRPALSLFLPKAAYYVAVGEDDVDPLLAAVSGALASEAGPDDCGRGLAIVCPIEAQYPIDLEFPDRDEASVDNDTAIGPASMRTA
ncbi:MAG: hypothetical protein AAB353_12965 [Candidatus Hydrogenedentota bacterium]